MSEERLKAFIANIESDANLQKKLKAAKSSKEVVGIAKEHGHDFHKDQFPLTAEELEAVAGGASTANLGTTTYVLAGYCS